MKKVQGNNRSIDAPKPLPGQLGEFIAKTVNEIWRDPRLRAHRGRECTELIFAYPFSFPYELKTRNRRLYRRLFPGTKKGLSSALVKAYRTAHYDGEPIKNRIRFLLREVVLTALQTLMENRKDAFRLDGNRMKSEQLSLRKGVVKRGQRKDERKFKRTAKRLARRYRELLPQVKQMRKFIKEKESLLTDTKLREEIGREFQYSWIPLITNGCALENLLPIPAHESSIETLSSAGWTVRQLAVGIIFCEEQGRDPRFRPGPGTIYEKYIAMGNRLITGET